MKSKFFKRVLCGAMALSMSAALISCGGGGGGTSNGGSESTGNSTSGGGNTSASTNINVLLFTGTATRNGAIKWIQDAAERFTALKSNEEYESGKKGVNIVIQDNKLIPYDSLSSDGNDIYVDEGRADMYTYSASGELMQLDEIVSYIEDEQKLTIDADAKKRMLGYESSDGKRHYYGLPQYEWSNSLTYDVNYFEDAGLYFAKPDATKSVTEETKYGTAKFVDPTDMQKSCGPDGVYGTTDDGLPSSLEEFAQLCDYIKSKKSGSPFIIPGGAGGSVYSFHMVQAIWAALEGAETMRSVTAEFSKKEVEVVTGFKSGEYFFGDKNIPMPITEKVVLNDDNGYKMYDMASRYYALAFMQLANDNDWFHSETKSDSSADKVQTTFIATNPNERAAMYIDGTYWYHEAKLYNKGAAFTQWKRTSGNKPRKLSYMCLPTTLKGSVAEGAGKKNTMLNVGSSFMFVNNRVSENAGKKRAVLEFLKFLYSKQELAAFTEFLGMNIPINYDYNETKLGDYYYKSFKKLRNEEAEVISTASDNPIQYKNLSNFLLGFGGVLNYYNYNGQVMMEGYLQAFRNGRTAKDIFSGSPLSEGKWTTLKANANK